MFSVMGPTGSGKSTFVKTASGLRDIVGHTLQSCTTEITAVEVVWQLPGGEELPLVFVDTPGFDDTDKSDTEILKLISDWLKDTYKNKAQLTGILYFHRISDNRMAGTPLKNLKMFEKLCGGNAFNGVTFISTMWDDVDHSIGEEREKELVRVYWQSMVACGSRYGRFMGTLDSVCDIIYPLFLHNDKAVTALHKSTLQLQQEIVDEKKALPETDAGRALYSELEAQVARQQRVLQQLKDDLTHTKMSPADTRELIIEYEQARNKAAQTLEEMNKLHIGRVGWFQSFLSKTPLRWIFRSKRA